MKSLAKVLLLPVVFATVASVSAVTETATAPAKRSPQTKAQVTSPNDVRAKRTAAARKKRAVKKEKKSVRTAGAKNRKSARTAAAK